MLAEGAWSETYYEHLNRDAFDNAATFHARFPNHVPTIQPTCLPYVNQPDHPYLAALRARVAARIPAPQTPQLLADGAVLLPVADSPPNAWRFAIPAGTATLRLRSPAASPAEISGSPATRRLGLRLHAATLEGPNVAHAIDLSAPDLGEGWHAPERADGTTWRWTDGDAALALPVQGPATLTLHGYAMQAAAVPLRAAA